MIEHGRLLGGSETLIAQFQEFVRSRLADWPGAGG
jgi:hypothetical protein